MADAPVGRAHPRASGGIKGNSGHPVPGQAIFDRIGGPGQSLRPGWVHMANPTPSRTHPRLSGGIKNKGGDWLRGQAGLDGVSDPALTIKMANLSLAGDPGLPGRVEGRGCSRRIERERADLTFGQPVRVGILNILTVGPVPMGHTVLRRRPDIVAPDSQVDNFIGLEVVEPSFIVRGSRGDLSRLS